MGAQAAGAGRGRCLRRSTRRAGHRGWPQSPSRRRADWSTPSRAQRQRAPSEAAPKPPAGQTSPCSRTAAASPRCRSSAPPTPSVTGPSRPAIDSRRHVPAQMSPSPSPTGPRAAERRSSTLRVAAWRRRLERLAREAALDTQDAADEPRLKRSTQRDGYGRPRFPPARGDVETFAAASGTGHPPGGLTRASARTPSAPAPAEWSASADARATAA